MRYGFGQTGRGELTPSRPRWSGPNEKPVFGDEPANRRRGTKDDFFNDIFGGKETPRRRSERDALGSNPGSRVLSPAPPLPHKAEPFGTSLPPHFSLPAKLRRRTELPTFGSTSLSLDKNRNSALNDSTTYLYTPLSRSSSQADLNDLGQNNVADGSTSKCDADEVQEKGNIGSKASGRGRQFHFSIYKWPKKGVPVVLPLGRLGGSRFRDSESPGKGADEDDEQSCLPSLIDVKDMETAAAADENVSTEREAESDRLPESGKPVKDASGDVSSEAQGPKRNSIGSFLFDEEDDEGEEEAREDKSKAKYTRHTSGDSGREKKPKGRRGSSDSMRSAKPRFPSSSSMQREVGNTGAKGKVKEFVKIFNQGASILAGGEFLGQSSRWRGKEKTGFDTNKTTNVDEAEQMMSGDQKKQSPDYPAVGRNTSRVSEKKDSDKNMKNNGSYCVSGQEVREESSPAQVTPEEAEESFHVNFEVREITEDENNLEQPDEDAEDIQFINANIRNWSNGKIGNIRSLLSTLQYILWPESGWKPVPLMEMIEGNAVRRSYQKALLILHPDKLQQKGASANQKYIAERVFELLQEAWEHFISIAPL